MFSENDEYMEEKLLSGDELYVSPVLGKDATAVFPAGKLAVTYQLPGSVAYSVCDQPEMGFHTSCPTVVLLPSLPVIGGKRYGPQLPFAADVTHTPLASWPLASLDRAASAWLESVCPESR
jgi:hypothetical protein